MNRGGDQHTGAQGFTIVETLIVLAVTGVLFTSAALLINGRQNKTDFDVGIRNIRSSIQQVINETSSGYYPNNSNFVCTASPTGPIITAGGNEQGANSGCIFVGKVMAFGEQAGASPKRIATASYLVYPLTGNRQVSGTTDDVTTLQEAKPVVLAPTTSGPNMNAPDMADLVKLPNGLEYVKGRQKDGIWRPATTAFAFALTSSLANFQPVAGTDQAGGAQNIELHGFNFSVWLGANEAAAINAQGSAAGGYPRWAEGVELCFASGGTDQSGLITIGAGGGIGVDLQIKTGRVC